MERKIEASRLCALYLLISCCINVTAEHAVVRRMVVRLAGVPGLAARRNDVLFAPSARRAPGPPHALVYWGGDVQDYPEVMQSHRDNKNYLRWNLENTARVLSRNFPTKHIVVVRPSRIEYKSFSCYDNFVPSNNAGVPDHTPTHSALQHLHRLLQEVSNRIKAMPEAELLEALNSARLPEDIDIEDLHNSRAQRPESGLEESTDDRESSLTPTAGPLWWAERLELHEAVLALAGFSKGCVVLNQLVYEIHYTHTLTPEDQQMLGFISRIEAMYWLDGGHAGGRNTWLTSRSLLETLTRLGVNIFIHVSPYQVQDEARPWIGREEKAFTAMLKKLGAKVHRYLHDGQGAPPSLHMHFDVVGNFKRLQDSSVASIPDSSDEDH